MVGTDTVGESLPKWDVTQDRLGRIFTGDNSLHVFDGQAWKSFPVPGSRSLRPLVFDRDGRLWTGALNEMGYFEETSLGVFEYRSLVHHLTPEDRQPGDIWGCYLVGKNVYFIGKTKIFRWDGTAFQTWDFPGNFRLFSFQFEGAPWVHHLDSGLYRLTDHGPELAIPAHSLPDRGVFAMKRDSEGIIVVSSRGFYRVGPSVEPVFDLQINQLLKESIVTSCAIFADGSYGIGTINNGLVIINSAGRRVHDISTNSGLGVRSVMSIKVDANNFAWGTTGRGVFMFDATGAATAYDARNGLAGGTVQNLKFVGETLYVSNQQNISHLRLSASGSASFEVLPGNPQIYFDLKPYGSSGLLASRHGGIEIIKKDGRDVSLSFFGVSVLNVFPSHARFPDFFASESRGISLISPKADGTYSRKVLFTMPDDCGSLHEDTKGKLWAATASRGVFICDPAAEPTKRVTQISTSSDKPGNALVLGNDYGILVFHSNQVFHANADGSNLRPLQNIPAFEARAGCFTSNGKKAVILFAKKSGSEKLAQGAGILSLEENGQPQWRELDPEPFTAAGFVRDLEFSTEADGEILWAGGSDGVARIEFAALAYLRAPTAPIIRLDDSRPTVASTSDENEFDFKNHHVRFQLFTGDYPRGKLWLFQTRFAESDWSAPTSRTTYEFTNLSEGKYGFEARALTPEGVVGQTSSYAFKILPPWYRSTPAYAGYAILAGLTGFGVIRFRERRSRKRTRQLQDLVKIRTLELEKASAAKDEFLASVSHEIRNPMNGVIGIAETFKTSSLDEESRHKFGLLRQCANHLSSLLEDILDFSRVQAGATELEIKPFEPYILVQSIAAITSTESAERGVIVEIAVSPAVPRHLLGDPRRVRQILLNFVGNALKFAGRGRIEVTVWCKAAGTNRTELFFAVSDEGPGITPEEQAKLFTRFERGTSAQQQRIPGTGLGLALSKTLAEKMGGRIWVESESGHGSCFYFSAPFEIAPAATATATPTPMLVLSGSKTALVVDDEEYNRLALTSLLEEFGIKVQSAGDGATALAIAVKERFDLVFLDYHLPGMSGLEIARALRASQSATATAVIVATTAFNSLEKRTQCLDAGMNTFLEKPVSMERLRQTLSTLGLGFSETTATPTPEPTIDRLAHLRLLVSKKQLNFSEELTLYFVELRSIHDELQTALSRRNIPDACYHAHQLYGRFAFIGEAALEQTLRKIEAAAATADWATAAQLAHDLPQEITSLHLAVVSREQTAPRA
ncbi:ATP-binding protein [Oleiharenicola lentus]|uniref:ATP-binding protein n=1 Tax=Oleiharenicola lentus TaxID=2508720 RepID=UPI003F676E37